MDFGEWISFWQVRGPITYPSYAIVHVSGSFNRDACMATAVNSDTDTLSDESLTCKFGMCASVRASARRGAWCARSHRSTGHFWGGLIESVQLLYFNNELNIQMSDENLLVINNLRSRRIALEMNSGVMFGCKHTPSADEVYITGWWDSSGASAFCSLENAVPARRGSTSVELLGKLASLRYRCCDMKIELFSACVAATVIRCVEHPTSWEPFAVHFNCSFIVRKRGADSNHNSISRNESIVKLNAHSSVFAFRLASDSCQFGIADRRIWFIYKLECRTMQRRSWYCLVFFTRAWTVSYSWYSNEHLRNWKY